MDIKDAKPGDVLTVLTGALISKGIITHREIESELDSIASERERVAADAAKKAEAAT